MASFGSTEIKLDAFNRNTGHLMMISFATEDSALAWIERHTDTAAQPVNLYFVGESQDSTWIPVNDSKLHARIYPTCEHGMSAQMCSGPNHFGEVWDEWAN